MIGYVGDVGSTFSLIDIFNYFSYFYSKSLFFSEHKETKGWFGLEFVANVTICPLIGSDLQVFDVNTDGFDDLVCHTSNGTITITESHIVDQRPSGISADTGRVYYVLCRKLGLF